MENVLVGRSGQFGTHVQQNVGLSANLHLLRSDIDVGILNQMPEWSVATGRTQICIRLKVENATKTTNAPLIVYGQNGKTGVVVVQTVMTG